jgi:hypothetical protein
MQAAERREFFKGVLDTFLSHSKEKGYVVFEVSGHPNEYVQFQLHSGRVYGEVGSRQWSEPEEPLPAAAVDALALLAFTGGGPEKNYSKDGLPSSAAELAEVANRLFKAAYGVDDEFSPVVREINLKDIVLPRAEPFTRHLIEAHLRSRDVQFLRDDDGDFRADISCEGSEEPVTIWFVAQGSGDVIYHITGLAPHRPVPGDRAVALERCNTWNREHRWPKAMVVDHGDAWRIVTHGDIDLAPGVTRSLFESLTDHLFYGILEFWTWIAAPADVSMPANNETPSDQRSNDS